MAKKKVTDPVVSSVATRASPNGINKVGNASDAVPQPQTFGARIAEAMRGPGPGDGKNEAPVMKKQRIAVSQKGKNGRSLFVNLRV
jgi:hypothetical protein